eukprot:6174304-Amphidinium_carterae.1
MCDANADEETIGQSHPSRRQSRKLNYMPYHYKEVRLELLHGQTASIQVVVQVRHQARWLREAYRPLQLVRWPQS